MDHHTASSTFILFFQKEIEMGRGVPGDWIWLVPPISGICSLLLSPSLNLSLSLVLSLSLSLSLHLNASQLHNFKLVYSVNSLCYISLSHILFEFVFSGSLSPVFHQEMMNWFAKPNFFNLEQPPWTDYVFPEGVVSSEESPTITKINKNSEISRSSGISNRKMRKLTILYATETGTY
jgi:hypothetical protein